MTVQKPLAYRNSQSTSVTQENTLYSVKSHYKHIYVTWLHPGVEERSQALQPAEVLQ